jgi:hypothetical protein
MKPRLSFARPALVLLALTGAASAEEPSKPQCFDAHERAQVAQKAGKLTAARSDFQTCAKAVCPKLVSKDCAAQLEKITAELASVQISVLDAGSPAPVAKLSIDGVPVEGAGPVELDPGDHTFVAELPDGRKRVQRVSLRQGERDKAVTLDIEAPKAKAPPAEPGPAPEPAKKRVSPAVWALGGVAVLGLGGFVGFGLSGKSKESDLDACKPSCASSDVDSMRSSYLFADISLGIALVASGVGAYLYVKGNKQEQQSVYVRATPTRHGGAAALGGRF